MDLIKYAYILSYCARPGYEILQIPLQIYSLDKNEIVASKTLAKRMDLAIQEVDKNQQLITTALRAESQILS